MNDSKSKEIRAFERFCKIRELDIDTYEDKSPPEPDVLATAGGASIAYELTEAVEPAYARKLSDMFKTPQMVRDGYDALPAETRVRLDAAHHGKMIDPCFDVGVSLRDRRAAPGRKATS